MLLMQVPSSSEIVRDFGPYAAFALIVLIVVLAFVLKLSKEKRQEAVDQQIRLAGSESTDSWKLWFTELYKPLVEGQGKLLDSHRELVTSHKMLIESHERMIRAAERHARDMEYLTRIHITTQERVKFVIQALGNRVTNNSAMDGDFKGESSHG
jgi:hypothetical protein